ncbi:ECF transporter S component [Carnobacteriaceae bacterium zg-ZUI240]|nr:ECF transporter S component [Carnobacteriaceae bacterium zg-ZUI240]
MNNKKISVRDLTILGVFTALVILQTFTPYLGYIRFGFVDITIIHVTVIIAATLLGWKKGAIIGGVWGISSLAYAYASAGILNPLFYNPLISVVPRILVGLVAGATFVLLKKRLNQHISAGIAGVVGTLTNTILVLGAMYTFGYSFLADTLHLSGGVGDPVLTFILSLVTTNTLFEVLIAAVVVPAIVNPLKRLMTNH